jgi:hypothetical protein
MTAVAGFCPVCGRESLMLGAAGHVTCGHLECPRPDAASELLADRETEHIVVFDRTGYTIRHPLRERLDDALMACALHAYCLLHRRPDGRYRATQAGTARRWMWEPITRE